MIPKVCFICGDEHPRRKTKRYIIRGAGTGRSKSTERAVELCKEHGQPFEDILAAPPRGSRHTLKVYKSFAEVERAKRSATSRG